MFFRAFVSSSELELTLHGALAFLQQQEAEEEEEEEEEEGERRKTCLLLLRFAVFNFSVLRFPLN